MQGIFSQHTCNDSLIKNEVATSRVHINAFRPELYSDEKIWAHIDTISDEMLNVTLRKAMQEAQADPEKPLSSSSEQISERQQTTISFTQAEQKLHQEAAESVSNSPTDSRDIIRQLVPSSDMLQAINESTKCILKDIPFEIHKFLLANGNTPQAEQIRNKLLHIVENPKSFEDFEVQASIFDMLVDIEIIEQQNFAKSSGLGLVLRTYKMHQENLIDETIKQFGNKLTEAYPEAPHIAISFQNKIEKHRHSDPGKVIHWITLILKFSAFEQLAHTAKLQKDGPYVTQDFRLQMRDFIFDKKTWRFDNSEKIFDYKQSINALICPCIDDPLCGGNDNGNFDLNYSITSQSNQKLWEKVNEKMQHITGRAHKQYKSTETLRSLTTLVGIVFTEVFTLNCMKSKDKQSLGGAIEDCLLALGIFGKIGTVALRTKKLQQAVSSVKIASKLNQYKHFEKIKTTALTAYSGDIAWDIKDAVIQVLQKEHPHIKDITLAMGEILLMVLARKGAADAMDNIKEFIKDIDQNTLKKYNTYNGHTSKEGNLYRGGNQYEVVTPGGKRIKVYDKYGQNIKMVTNNNNNNNNRGKKSLENTPMKETMLNKLRRIKKTHEKEVPNSIRIAEGADSMVFMVNPGKDNCKISQAYGPSDIMLECSRKYKKYFDQFDNPDNIDLENMSLVMKKDLAYIAQKMPRLYNNLIQKKIKNVRSTDETIEIYQKATNKLADITDEMTRTQKWSKVNLLGKETTIQFNVVRKNKASALSDGTPRLESAYISGNNLNEEYGYKSDQYINTILGEAQKFITTAHQKHPDTIPMMDIHSMNLKVRKLANGTYVIDVTDAAANIWNTCGIVRKNT